jgi:hypothetical protein
MAIALKFERIPYSFTDFVPDLGCSPPASATSEDTSIHLGKPLDLPFRYSNAVAPVGAALFGDLLRNSLLSDVPSIMSLMFLDVLPLSP